MSLAKLKEVAVAKIDASSDLLLSVSSRLWQNPELALEERMAHQMLTDVLEQSGFTVCRHFVLDTGFKATFGSSETARPHVAVMCEFDALPGIGHACGHNLIAEVAVGAGLGIKAAIETGDLVGRVTVLGTPAEESHGGKIDMIKSGFFDDVDIAMMAHPYKLTLARPCTLSMCALEATFTGKASHAAGSPWDGLNALDAAMTAYQSVSNLRQQMRPDWRVHGIVKDGGQRPNIIPERAVLEYYVRAPTDKELTILRRKVEACFQGAALATGCKLQLDMHGNPNSNVVTSEPLIELYTRNLTVLKKPFVESDPDSVIGSTDMGNVSYAVPSIHPMFTVDGNAANHTREFTKLAGGAAAQPHALAQAKALAMTGIDILARPSELAKVEESFRADMERLKVS